MEKSPDEIYCYERSRSNNRDQFICYEDWLELRYSEMVKVLKKVKGLAECNGWYKSDISKPTYDELVETIKKMSTYDS